MRVVSVHRPGRGFLLAFTCAEIPKVTIAMRHAFVEAASDRWTLQRLPHGRLLWMGAWCAFGNDDPRVWARECSKTTCAVTRSRGHEGAAVGPGAWPCTPVAIITQRPVDKCGFRRIRHPADHRGKRGGAGGGLTQESGSLASRPCPTPAPVTVTRCRSPRPHCSPIPHFRDSGWSLPRPRNPCRTDRRGRPGRRHWPGNTPR